MDATFDWTRLCNASLHTIVDIQIGTTGYPTVYSPPTTVSWTLDKWRRLFIFSDNFAFFQRYPLRLDVWLFCTIKEPLFNRRSGKSELAIHESRWMPVTDIFTNSTAVQQQLEMDMQHVLITKA